MSQFIARSNYKHRTFDGINIWPLPVRTPLHPWEDLASFLSRVSAEMGYRHPGWILDPEEIPYAIRNRNLLLLCKEADYTLLGHLLSLGEEKLYELTLHRFAARLQPPELSEKSSSEDISHPLLSIRTSRAFISSLSAPRVCPMCLDEGEAFGRLYWNILPAVTCPLHNIFLIDRCPVCFRPIPLLRSSLTRCPKCQSGDYRMAQRTFIEVEQLFQAGQLLMLKQLEIFESGGRGQDTEFAQSPLVELFPWQYFRLLDAFCHILGPLLPDAPLLRVSPALRALLPERPHLQRVFSLYEWVVLIATFHSIFDSWPEIFFAFLESYPLVRQRDRLRTSFSCTTGLEHDFGMFYTDWLYRELQDTSFTFLREAFADYLGRRYTGGVLSKYLKPFQGEEAKRLKERPFVTKQQAKGALGVGERVLRSFIDRGLLRTERKARGIKEKNTLFLIEKDSLETLRQEWFDLIPLSIVAHQIIGTAAATLLTLQETGLLIPSQGPSIEGYGQNLRLYKKTDVERFVSNILQRCVKASSATVDGVYLTRALNTAKLGLAGMLTEILNGRLTPIDLGTDKPLLRRLMLTGEELSRYIEEEERRQRDGMGLFTIEEGAAFLGMTRYVILRYARLCLLEREALTVNGRRSRILLRKQTLEAFRDTYVSMEEAAVLIHLEMGTVQNYVSRGLLHPVDEIRKRGSKKLLLFLREEVELLAPSTSMSLLQAASYLGISCTAVTKLVSSGRLPAVGSPGKFTRPIHILRADLEAYRQRKVEEVRQFVSKRRLELTTDEDAWISTRDAAELLGVSDNALTKWVRQGRIPASKQKRPGLPAYRFKLEDLERFVLGDGHNDVEDMLS